MYRYIKPTHTVSKSRIIQKLEQLTKQSDTKMFINKNGKRYEFKFTVEQFATRRQAFIMLDKAQNSPHWQQFFTEV